MKGLTGSLFQESPLPLMGVVLPGSNAAEIFFSTIQHLDKYSFLVYIPSVNQNVVQKFKKLNIRYTTDIQFFILNAYLVDAVLTFGCLPHPAHKSVLLLISLFRELRIPTFDLQHGLFQWGINFVDDSLEQGYEGVCGISLPLKTMADHQLTWSGNNAVGYPRYTAAPAPAPAGNHILIATNTNWHIYSNEDRVRLMRIFDQLFTSLDTVEFIWKPHPAEFSPTNDIVLELINAIHKGNRYPNVSIYNHNAPQAKTLTELISECRAGITTVGTSVIDFEMLGKPCAIFNCSSVSSLLSSLEKKFAFHSFQDILSWFNDIDNAEMLPVTGQLQPFSADNFNNIVSVAMKPAKMQQKKPDVSIAVSIKYLVTAKTLGLMTV
ncbi:MAG: hypothetical protein QM645_03595 [Asticcacaulis sp.]